MLKYDFLKIEKKWQKKWQRERTYEPNLARPRGRGKFYNLMMFPYPSAEGLHVGNMYAFTGADIYGRFKRMQGYDVFEPIGLDGFGIHSENYALKIGVHPMKQAKISEKRFYQQLQSIGNGFAWEEKLETYDSDYYRWTQWIFLQLFKNGLAYRKRAPVNWCPGCMTVLADEQVIQKFGIRNSKFQINFKSQIPNHKYEARVGVCERCETPVIKKELEQWFFRITKYAERLLQNLEKIDWTEKVKIVQRNWIGKNEGALIDFEIAGGIAPSYVLLHGYKGSPNTNFFPWLKKELEKRGAKVYVPKLPDPRDPKVYDQVAEVLKSVRFDENTVLVGHSLGGVVAMKILEKLKKPVRKTILVASFTQNRFLNKAFRTDTFDWEFDPKKIKDRAGEIHILRDTTDDTVPQFQAENIRNLFGGTIFDFAANEPHVCGEVEPEVLRHCIDLIRVFTTRPDTIFGATYIVLGPEHSFIASLLGIQFGEVRPPKVYSNIRRSNLQNIEEVRDYIRKVRSKSEEERIVEGRRKTGVELKGIKAINPANKEEIPVWVADYVLGDVGTGAIMAVPAHDQRDFEFAKKFNLPIKMVICPNYPAPVCPVLDKTYEGDGYLVDSGKFTGMKSEKAKWAITKYVGGKKMVQYRLRDWLVSRQRYWGPPIPLVFCETCKKRVEISNSQFLISKQQLKDFSKGELENPGWIAVPEKNLPVELPFVKDFRPKGKGESPLASVKSFYETNCPKCGCRARRETDVSDTFLDSAWYYIGYLWVAANPKSQIPNSKQIQNPKSKIQNSPFSNPLTKKWLPVNLYIGGAEHAVLHLLYVRFLALALHDLNLLDFGKTDAPKGEPLPRFRAHGLLIKEGAKMSKSRGNVVVPDEYIKKFGADALRMYLMFLAPFEQGGDFRDAAILGVSRFLERVWRLFFNIRTPDVLNVGTSDVQRLNRLLHKTIKKVTEDIENLRYNTAISALMILFNSFEEKGAAKEEYGVFLKLLAPFAPHLTEELWQRLGNKTSIHQEKWPKFNSKLIQEDNFNLIIQVNGKLSATAVAERGISQKEAETLALSVPKVKKILNGKKPKKIIFISDRLINFVV